MDPSINVIILYTSDTSKNTSKELGETVRERERKRGQEKERRGREGARVRVGERVNGKEREVFLTTHAYPAFHFLESSLLFSSLLSFPYPSIRFLSFISPVVFFSIQHYQRLHLLINTHATVYIFNFYIKKICCLVIVYTKILLKFKYFEQKQREGEGERVREKEWKIRDLVRKKREE